MLNRLIQVQCDDGTAIHYTYDAVSNRLRKDQRIC
jgi:YD repeat-containing protein